MYLIPRKSMSAVPPTQAVWANTKSTFAADAFASWTCRENNSKKTVKQQYNIRVSVQYPNIGLGFQQRNQAAWYPATPHGHVDKHSIRAQP